MQGPAGPSPRGREPTSFLHSASRSSPGSHDPAAYGLPAVAYRCQRARYWGYAAESGIFGVSEPSQRPRGALPGSPGATGPCGQTQGRDLLSRHQDACPIQASPRPRLGSCSGCRCLGQGHREGAHGGGRGAGPGAARMDASSLPEQGRKLWRPRAAGCRGGGRPPRSTGWRSARSAVHSATACRAALQGRGGPQELGARGAGDRARPRAWFRELSTQPRGKLRSRLLGSHNSECEREVPQMVPGPGAAVPAGLGEETGQSRWMHRGAFEERRAWPWGDRPGRLNREQKRGVETQH